MPTPSSKDDLRPSIDVITYRLASRFSREELVNDVAVPIWAELAETAWSALPAQYRSENSVLLRSQEAALYLPEVIRRWDRKSRKTGQMTRAKWLYVARRIPDLLFDVVASIHGIPEHSIPLARTAIRRLLVAQTGLAPIMGEHPTIMDNAAVYDLTETEAADVIRRLFMVEYLWRIQNTSRWAGKGGCVRVDRGAAPTNEPDEELSASTEIFDERMRVTPASVTSLAGTTPWEDAGTPGARTICFLVDTSDPDIVSRQTPTGAARTVGGMTAEQISIAQTYPILQVDLTSFVALSRFADQPGDVWYDQELPTLLTLLYTVSHAIGSDEYIEWQLVRIGYLRVTSTELRGLFGKFGEQINAFLRELLPSYRPGSDHPVATVARLKKMQGEVDPILDGPVIRKDPDGWMLLDIAAASRRLLWRPTVGRYGGAAPNARAQHYEATVQASIDATGFGPESVWRSLIGRQLKRADGTSITDIDAIAVIEDALILIDAKSYPYTAEYGAGKYSEVKNVTDKLTVDLAKWASRIGELRATPTGRNYDLRTAKKTVGLVVTPFPCYLPQTLAETEALPGLRAASSLDELRSYLNALKAATNS